MKEITLQFLCEEYLEFNNWSPWVFLLFSQVLREPLLLTLSPVWFLMC